MKIMATLLTTAMILSVFGAAGCDSKTPGPKKGSDCVVQFRRDALGAAAGNPIPPTTQELNGAGTCVLGKFSRMDEDWVVLTDTRSNVFEAPNPNTQMWIPRSLILLITASNKNPAATNVVPPPVGRVGVPASSPASKEP